MPDTVSRSGDEIRAAFESGQAVSWRFTRKQSRLAMELPGMLGGRTVTIALEGGYTFTPRS
jgi:hypothetical protein